MEAAIAAYEKALLVWTQTDFPMECAGIQHNLGNAYRKINQDLAQAAKDIKNLLNQLSEDYPNDSYRVLSAKAMDEVDKNPQLKYRIIRGLKAGSLAALEKMIDHPVAQFLIEGVKEVLNP